MDPGQIDRILRQMEQARFDIVERAQRLLADAATERALQVTGKLLRETGSSLLRDALKASQRFVEAFSEAIPDNWQELTNPQVFAAVDLMARTGWSLLWTPPAETVVELLNSSNPEVRRAILLSVEPRVLFDLDDLLDRVDDSNLTQLRDATRESLEAHRSGYFAASQALTASIISSVLHENLGKSHRKIRKKFLEANNQEASIREFRWVAVQLAVGKILDEYHPVNGTPERSDFNRHASVHRVKEPQYRQVNALTALMLLTSLLIELNDLPECTSRSSR